jgi:hypothetical protein
MKKALVTALLLASSSVAMAKPVTYTASASVSIDLDARWGRPTVARPPVRDHRTPAPAPVPYRRPATHVPPVIVDLQLWNPTNTTLGGDSSTYVGAKPFMQTRISTGAWRPSSWVQMTEPTRIDRGREFFTFGSQAGSFSQLQILETHGQSHIQQVVIEFVGDPRAQKVVFNADLTRGNSLFIDLDGDFRQINRVIVYGATANGSAYQINGR